MAAGCIKGGALEVMNSGDAYVNIKLGSHTMMGLTAYAFDWKIFNKYNVTSALTDAEIVSQDSEGNVTEGHRFVKAAKLHTDRKTGELTASVKVEKVPVVSERKITVLYTAACKGQVGMAQLTVNSDVSRLSAADCAETMPKGYEFVKSGKISKIGIVRITVRPIGR